MGMGAPVAAAATVSMMNRADSAFCGDYKQRN
jgi:hypothetical protein